MRLPALAWNHYICIPFPQILCLLMNLYILLPKKDDKIIPFTPSRHITLHSFLWIPLAVTLGLRPREYYMIAGFLSLLPFHSAAVCNTQKIRIFLINNVAAASKGKKNYILYLLVCWFLVLIIQVQSYSLGTNRRIQ